MSTASPRGLNCRLYGEWRPWSWSHDLSSTLNLIVYFVAFLDKAV